jgi:hypothetical protein
MDNKSFCDVCGTEGETQLAASPLGPVSLAYCRECQSRNAEPFMMIATAIFTSGGLEAFDETEISSMQTFDEGEYLPASVVCDHYVELEPQIRKEFFG